MLVRVGERRTLSCVWRCLSTCRDSGSGKERPRDSSASRTGPGSTFTKLPGLIVAISPGDAESLGMARTPGSGRS